MYLTGLNNRNVSKIKKQDREGERKVKRSVKTLRTTFLLLAMNIEEIISISPALNICS
jgi:hypothetical protein